MSKTDKFYVTAGGQMIEFEAQCAVDVVGEVIYDETRMLDVERVWGPGLPEMKDNPKALRAAADNKQPLEFIPLKTLEGTARVLESGAAKYGKRNWRQDPIKASTYQGAFLRHLTAYYEGETTDPDSGEDHLSHVMANCMVMLDAALAGTLIDDRDEAESK